MSAGALRLVLVEVSPAQRAQHPAHPLVTSAASVGAALLDGAAAGVVVANELLDNLPFDIVQRTENGWQELLVCSDSGSSRREVAPHGAVPHGAVPQGSGPQGSGPLGVGSHDPGSKVAAPSGAGPESVGPEGAGPEVAGLDGAGPGDGFALMARPAASGLVEGLPDVAVGARVPVQRAARRWVAEAHGVLQEGWIVAFDYGADTAELARRSVPAGDGLAADVPAAGRRSADALVADGPAVGGLAVGGRSAASTTVGDLASGLGWLRTHRHHDRGSSWIRDPGSCDVTADVATDQVQAEHRAEVCTQAEFLNAHGIDRLVSEGRALWADHAGVGDLKALAARSRMREAEALLDPDGMGGFKALLWRVG